MKVVLFGAGENARRFIRLSPAAKRVEIVGIVDNDSAKWGEEFEQLYTIESPAAIRSKEWDKIVVTPAVFFVIKEQLMKEYGIERGRIIRGYDLIIPARANMGSVRVSGVSDECYDINEIVPDQVIPENRLEEFYFKAEHRGVSKWWHYFEVYQTFFQKFVGSDVKILEIGVNMGGSLQMWKDYFGEKATVVGVDINPDCKQFEEENIHICIGSQADRDFLLSVSEQWGPFDIVVDDGSHVSSHQILTFETLFPLLNENGVFICEDCQCCYLPGYGGGYKKDTFIEYSKGYVDCVNSQYVDLDKIQELPFYKDYIKACHYYDAMVVVEKKHRGYSFYSECD